MDSAEREGWPMTGRMLRLCLSGRPVVLAAADRPFTGLALSLLGKHFGEGFDRAVRKADERTASMGIGALDQPWLGRPFVGRAWLAVENGRKIMKESDFRVGTVAVFDHGRYGRAPPGFGHNVVGLERLEPKF